MLILTLWYLYLWWVNWTGVPWTEEEHKLFLLGLQKVGKGDWRGISRNYVKTRTPTQVASHAQKYFLRRSNLNRRRRRSSLFDITTDTVISSPHCFLVSSYHFCLLKSNELRINAGMWKRRLKCCWISYSLILFQVNSQIYYRVWIQCCFNWVLFGFPESFSSLPIGSQAEFSGRENKINKYFWYSMFLKLILW